MRPLKTSTLSPALAKLIQMAHVLCGKQLPTVESILTMLSECQSVELAAIPKDPEPGLERVLIARIGLEDTSCR